MCKFEHLSKIRAKDVASYLSGYNYTRRHSALRCDIHLESAAFLFHMNRTT